MSNKKARYTLQIEILNKSQHLARALPDVTPLNLMNEIITEFKGDVGFEHLNQSLDQLVLERLEDGEFKSFEDLHQPLGQQNLLIRDTHNLRLRERDVTCPNGATALPTPFYLREFNHNIVYKINWTPAFIGRPDPNAKDNDQLAVDLRKYSRGQRVSRRHIKITELDGKCQLTLINENKAQLKRHQGEDIDLVLNQPVMMEGDDRLLLSRSGIELELLRQA